MFASGQDVIYSPERRTNTKSAIKITQLQELILALDELAIETDGGSYPEWLFSQIKDLYTLLRSTFDQLVNGGTVQTTREELLEKVYVIRHGIEEIQESSRKRSSSPRREPRLTPLISHCTGAEYCRKVFHTQRQRGRLVHTPGPPNPPPDSVRNHQSRRWLIETALLSGRKVKSARKKSKLDVQFLLLKDRARNLEQQLHSELRRELRSEQALAQLREEDRWGFQQMLDKLDYLAEILRTRPIQRPESPAPAPVLTSPRREIVVDNSRIDELELELNEAKKRHSKDVADREARIASLMNEITSLRLQSDEYRKKVLELENEIARLKADDGSDRRLLQDKIDRLEENVKELTRSERRLTKRERQLSEDKADLERRLQELESELNRSKKHEEDLLAKLASRSELVEPPPSPPAAVKPLFDVVSKVLYRHYLTKFRKEAKIRSELQATLEMTANAAERARRSSEQQLNTLRANLMAEIDAQHAQLDSKDIANRQLQDQVENLLKERGELERRLTVTIETDRRKSLEEIQHLQSQLAVIKTETKPEPAVFDMEPFKKMLLESFQGDYLNLEDNPTVLHILFTQGDERVLFSDRVEKLNHRNFKEKRIIVISYNALYLLMPKAWELKRVFKIDDIDKITMSRRSADHICIHHRNEEDLFFISSKRYEIVHFLMSAFKQKTSTDLQYHFAERFYVEDRDMHYRLIEVPDTITVKLGRSVLLGPTE